MMRVVYFTVHNEGTPITLSAQAILLQQFRHTVAAEDGTGWGLGLFVAKSMTEAHQGTLVVESAAGRGTSFIVKRPQTAC